MRVSLSDKFPSPPQPCPEEFSRIVARDQISCQRLLSAWEGVIKRIAAAALRRACTSRYAITTADIDDLVQVGRYAVYQAACSFDETAGYPFAHYAKRAIKNNVWREAERLARQRALECKLDNNPKALEAPAAEGTCRAEVVEEVALKMADFPPSYQALFRLLYVEEMTQRAAAKCLRVTQPRVAQLHHALLQLSRTVLAA